MNITRRPPSPKSPSTGVAQAGPSLASLHRPGRSPLAGWGSFSAAEPGGPEKARLSSMEEGAMHQPGESPGTFSSWLGDMQCRVAPALRAVAQWESALKGLRKTEYWRSQVRVLSVHRRAIFFNGSSERQGAVACATPRSTGRGSFARGARIAITETLAGIGLTLALIAVLSLAETLPDTIFGALATEEPKPECREQWTDDARYVRHCDFHNGRGWVVTP